LENGGNYQKFTIMRGINLLVRHFHPLKLPAIKFDCYSLKNQSNIPVLGSEHEAKHTLLKKITTSKSFNKENILSSTPPSD
jgi:hypothetical protein